MRGTKNTLEKRRDHIIMPKRKKKGVRIYMESKLFAGSGTTGISCVFSERKYILIERDTEYFKIIEARIQKAKNPANLIEHGWF